DGYPVDAALCEARKAIYAAGNDIEWGTPVLYMRAVDGDLFDLAAFERTRQVAAAQTAAAAPAASTSQDKETTTQDLVADVDAAFVNPAPELDQPVAEPTNTTAEQTPPNRDSIASAGQEEQRRTQAETQSTREKPRIAPATKPHPKPQTVSTPKRRWWRVAVALVALIGVIYFSAIGIDNYQTTQRHNAQATALVKAHPTATAMAEEAAIVMVAAIPEAQRLVDDYGIRFVEVPAGEFRMGSTQAEIDDAFELCQQDYNSCSRDRFTDEAEQHTVSVDTFWIMQTEVTNAQFAAFVEAGGYAEEQWWTEAGWAWRTEKNSTAPYSWDTNWNQPDHPVVGISWYEAMAYAKWLTDQIDLPIRLPTEAEW
ncbi:MAG: SUMF1/EgtB/PvdO family nonheme iron enzyme, partial [Caldilineaceae bacterium]|nr:SUMF1/EgtB/PvdO family nonheme iron enzyme [Caldilineaceae bacterium]